jgi:hypothetical protein
MGEDRDQIRLRKNGQFKDEGGGHLKVPWKHRPGESKQEGKRISPFRNDFP